MTGLIKLPQMSPRVAALTIASVILLLWIQMNAWRRFANNFKSTDMSAGDRPMRAWWPPRLSNLLILL